MAPVGVEVVRAGVVDRGRPFLLHGPAGDSPYGHDPTTSSYNNQRHRHMYLATAATAVVLSIHVDDHKLPDSSAILRLSASRPLFIACHAQVCSSHARANCLCGHVSFQYVLICADPGSSSSQKQRDLSNTYNNTATHHIPFKTCFRLWRLAVCKFHQASIICRLLSHPRTLPQSNSRSWTSTDSFFLCGTIPVLTRVEAMMVAGHA